MAIAVIDLNCKRNSFVSEKKGRRRLITIYSPRKVFAQIISLVEGDQVDDGLEESSHWQIKVGLVVFTLLVDFHMFDTVLSSVEDKSNVSN